MGGLARICRQYGGLIADGVEYIWDYENEVSRKKSELTRKEIERIEDYRWKMILKKEGKLK